MGTHRSGVEWLSDIYLCHVGACIFRVALNKLHQHELIIVYTYPYLHMFVHATTHHHLLDTYRLSHATTHPGYRTSINTLHASNIYRPPIEQLSTIHRSGAEWLSNIYLCHVGACISHVALNNLHQP